MTFACCPSCNEQVRVPSAVSDEATLRCPWCQESFGAVEVFSKLPPMLEVVDDPGMIGAEAVTLPVALQVANPVGAAGFDGDAFRIESDTVDAAVMDQPVEMDVPAFEFEEGDAPQRETPSFTEGSSGTGAIRRPRKQRGAFIQVVPVILGGLAAIPLAQLCLWWVFGQDTFGAGPSVSKYVPFIVPSDFRDGVASSDESSKRNDADSEDADDSDSGRILLGANEPDPFSQDDSQRSPQGDDDNQSSDDTSQNSSADNPGDGLGRNNNIPDVIEGSDDDEQWIGGPRPPEVVDPMYVDLASPHEALRNIRSTEPEDVYAVLGDVQDGYDVWASPAADASDQRVAALDRYYGSMSELGDVLLRLDPTSDRSQRVADEVHEILFRNFLDEKHRKFISNRAARALLEPIAVSGAGVAFTGTLVSIERDGDYLANLIRMEDVSRTEVIVYGWIKPPDTFATGCKVAILGSRIDDPLGILQLETDQSEVIAGSFVMIVEPAPVDDASSDPANGEAP